MKRFLMASLTVLACMTLLSLCVEVIGASGKSIDDVIAMVKGDGTESGAEWL